MRMSAGYGSWTGPARALARAVDVAVSAARAGDADGFAEAEAELARPDRGQLAVLLGTIAQELIERGHPDGFDRDDAEQLLERCARSAAWYPQLDSDALVRALTDTLGAGLPDEAPTWGDVLIHGLLLIAVLVDDQRADLAQLIDHALRELQRAQTVELP
jgi:hypothetical protein